MAAPLKVFVSHNHKDSAFCRTIVQALRDIGADPWYDEHNMGPGRLGPTIERELRARPAFVVILSPAALASQWVEDESRWAYNLWRKEKSRVILPVLAAPIKEGDIWLFLQDFKRIGTPGQQPYSVVEATNRTLHALGLTPLATTRAAPQPAKGVDDLMRRGVSLKVDRKYADALTLFEQATQLDPNYAPAWNWRGEMLQMLQRYEEALAAYEQALAIQPNNIAYWSAKGHLLESLHRYEEALADYDRMLAIAPNEASHWVNKARPLRALGRAEEANMAMKRARELGYSY